MYKVAVLMSTYNGAKYLREQIDSIFSQDSVKVALYVRDDKSSDHTIEIIREYQENNTNIQLRVGENVGVGNSFMQLVCDVPNTYDYYAFADQDDVWLPQKLKKAIETIEDVTEPALYCSNQILVDCNLNRFGLRYDSIPDISYRQIMCQNKISGCTMLWNRKLQEVLSDKKRRPSEDLLNRRIHDVWVAMVASVVGSINYDKEGHILYRQHEANVVGVRNTNIVKLWSEKLKNPAKRNGRSLLCKEVYEKYYDLIGSDYIKNELNVFGNYTENKSYKKLLLKDNDLISHSEESLLGFKVKVLLDLF